MKEGFYRDPNCSIDPNNSIRVMRLLNGSKYSWYLQDHDGVRPRSGTFQLTKDRWRRLVPAPDIEAVYQANRGDYDNIE